MRTLLTLLLVLLTYGGVPALAQAGDAKAAAPTSTDIPADLQPLLRTLQEAVDAVMASKEGEKLATQLETLRIPENDTWFVDTFGSENGAKLASIYSQTWQRTESRLIEYFVVYAARGGQIAATLASGGLEQQKMEFEQKFDNAIRGALKRPALIYRVEYSSNPRQSAPPIVEPLGYVTLIRGAYRLMGGDVLRALPEMPTMRIRMGGKVAAGSLADKVPPVYPTEARRQHISGTVRLHAIIAKDGSIKTLEVVSGHPTLIDAARDAVKQWRYRPMLLEGEAVEVDTTIDVIFSLN
jgi:TonB family protein